MDFTITPGYARFDKDDVLFVVDHDDVKIVEIDMLTKYCNLWTAESDDSVDVFIDKNEDTLHFDPTANTPTVVTFAWPKDDTYAWHVIIEAWARYTARIVLYRMER